MRRVSAISIASEAGGAMYAAAQAEAGEAGAAGAAGPDFTKAGPADDGVVDAEVVDEGGEESK